MRSGFIGKFLFVSLLFIMPLTLRAQELDDLPCGDENNPFDTPCPLDTWVLALVIIAAICTSFHLYGKAKSAKDGKIGYQVKKN
jgi:hypothetical protein